MLSRIGVNEALDALRRLPPAPRPWWDLLQRPRPARVRRILVVWPLALVTGYLAMFSGPAGDRPWAHWTEFALATPVQFWGGWPFLREAAGGRAAGPPTWTP
jgi:cation transport ATPase